MIIFKTAVFIISFYFISKTALKIIRKRNPMAQLFDIEVVAVSVIFAAVITSVFKQIVKILI
jgi:hypothetical protein